MKQGSGPLQPSIESLLYRGDSPLYHELKLIFADLQAGDETALERIGKVIHHHTKMDITLQLTDNPDPDIGIYFIAFDVNHVFRSLQLKEGEKFDTRMLQRLLQGGKGAADSKGAVSGVFTKIPAVIVLSRPLVAKEFATVEELAAGTLHEIGHMYGYFDVLGRTLATSLLIQETLVAMGQTHDLAVRRQMVDTTVKILEFEDVDIEALATPGQEKAFEAVLIRNTVARIQGDMGDSKLFGVESEFLADSYAVRSGAAKPLASLMIKTAKLSNHLQAQSRLEYILTEACKVAFFAAATAVSIPLVAVLTGLTIAASSYIDYGDRNTPAERLEGIHADLVNLLKDTSLPHAQKEALLTDVRFVSGLREKLVERSTLVMQLWLTLSPSRRHAYKQAKLQREINKLVNNDLFVKAAQLSGVHPSA
jgi:hypothetical protein